MQDEESKLFTNCFIFYYKLKRKGKQLTQIHTTFSLALLITVCFGLITFSCLGSNKDLTANIKRAQVTKIKTGGKFVLLLLSSFVHIEGV